MTEAVEFQQTTFGIVPGWVEERCLDGTALRVYVRISHRYANRRRDAHPPAVKQLAEELVIGERTLRRALRYLESIGALQTVRSTKTNGDFGYNRYRLPLDDPRLADEFAGEAQRPNLAGNSSATATDGRMAAAKNGRSLSIPPENQTTDKDLVDSADPEPAEGKPTEAELLVGFEEWWQLYPRKVAKGNARKAYLSLLGKLKTRDDARELWQKLMAGVRRYAAEKSETDPQFIAHAATWLRGERWGDESERGARSSQAPKNSADDSKWEGYDLKKELEELWSGGDGGSPGGDGDQGLFSEVL